MSNNADIFRNTQELINLAVSDYTYKPKVYIGESVEEPVFPAIFLTMYDSYENENTVDSSDEEKFTNVAFQVDIYDVRRGLVSGDTFNQETDNGGARMRVYEIESLISKMLRKHNFIRTAFTPVNRSGTDSEMFRLTVRYEVTVSNNNTLYKR